MIIACSLDRRFCEPTGTMLASLVRNGDIGATRIIVFGIDLRPGDKRKLRACCGEHADRLEFFDVDPDHPTLRWLTSFWPKPSLAVYVRLLMPTLLADTNDKLISMDGDMLVVGSLRPLLETDLGDNVIAAVPDDEGTHPSKDPRPHRVDFPADAPYFNAGVMLIDLAKWRERGLTKKVFDIIDRERERLCWFDQDALNIALMGQWKPLDRVWNVFPIAAEALGGYDTARILHFTGGGKPWSEECAHPKQQLFLHYRDMTPWRGRRLQTRFQRRWRKILRKRKKKLAALWASLTPGSEAPAPERPRST